MIVDPDFLTHWRTQMLIDALDGDQMAPLYVIRIWAHCQQRKSTRHDAMPAAGLKALCRAPCDAEILERALIDAGFVERDGKAIEVPKWAEKNASLIAAWDNGTKGGRPPKEKPSENPRVSESEPMGNPDETQTEPIRGEKRREEEKTLPGKPAGPASEVLDYLNAKTGKHFRHVKANLALIQARMREGASAEVIRAVIDAKTEEWRGNPKMEQYLRPETLFGSVKFEGYVGALGKGKKSDEDWWLREGYGSKESALRQGAKEPA